MLMIRHQLEAAGRYYQSSETHKSNPLSAKPTSNSL